jgi:hypothetical protein
MSEIDVFFGKAGEPVPVVDVADMKVMWTHGQELKAQHPEGVAVEVGVWKQLCSPGADIRAVSYRCQMLGLLEMMLRAAWTGGELSVNALKVAARMDLHWVRSASLRTGSPSVWKDFLQKCSVTLPINNNGEIHRLEPGCMWTFIASSLRGTLLEWRSSCLPEAC